MRLQNQEAIIQEIVDECSLKQDRNPDTVFMEWRVKLEKAPTLLRPFQIDQIVREARGRLSGAG